MNNPPLKLTKDQWHALNRVVAIAEVAAKIHGWDHHRHAIEDAKTVMAVCETDPFTFNLVDCLQVAGLPVPAKLQKEVV